MSLPILGGTPTLPPYSAKNGQILRASPYFLLNFQDFPFKSYKIFKHLPHGNCQLFKRTQLCLKSLLKMVIFALFSPMKFSKTHQHNLIRVFTLCFMGSWGLKDSSYRQWRLWSNWADAKADLSLRWVHRPFCWFCRALTHTKLTTRLLLYPATQKVAGYYVIPSELWVSVRPSSVRPSALRFLALTLVPFDLFSSNFV